ncbi:MAG: gephyrin-like molybdotransferase Glp [Thermomicrobiales bacterium]
MPEPDTPLSERPWEDVERMLDVDQACEEILSSFAPLPAIDVAISDALGLNLAEEVIADVSVPPFTNSAMDGYAVRSTDTSGASGNNPIRLRVIGELAAGYPSTKSVEPGTAVRIMTGAPLPEGADAVVRFEETDEPVRGLQNLRTESETITIHHAAKRFDNVRLAGEDVLAGRVILGHGTRIRPAEIGILASLNKRTVSVHRRPLIAILSTGDEVVDLGRDLQPGQIRNSNSYTLAAMVERYGGVPQLLGVACDSTRDLQKRLQGGAKADMIVTSGGVSLGDYDVVKDVLAANGTIAIWQVRMKPGKPLAFGRLGGQPLLGLPGNPVAAAVSFEQFGRPAILKMLGRADLEIPCVHATLTERIDNRGHRRHFVRARVECDGNSRYTVRSAGNQGAGVLSSLARANGLLVIPEEIDVAEPGMVLPVQMIDWDLG